MELKRFNAITVPARGRAVKKPAISVNKNTGGISLNAAACELTGFTSNDKLEFVQDNANPEDWYITKSDDGFNLRSAKMGTKGLQACNKLTCTALINSVNGDIHRFTFPVGQIIKVDDMVLFPVLTSAAKPRYTDGL